MKKYIPVAVFFLLAGCSGKEFGFGSKNIEKEPKAVSAVFSPDSKKLVVIYTNSVGLYDAATGNKIIGEVSQPKAKSNVSEKLDINIATVEDILKAAEGK